jgi:hypothetical protein
VDSELLGCVPEVSIGSFERPLDQSRFKGLTALVECNPALDHLGHEPIEEVA